MLTKLTQVTIWVHDQDEALAFYTSTLGMEVREDVTIAEMGNFHFSTDDCEATFEEFRGKGTSLRAQREQQKPATVGGSAYAGTASKCAGRRCKSRSVPREIDHRHGRGGLAMAVGSWPVRFSLSVAG